MPLGPDDIVELGINYLPSFLIAILFCIGTWLVLIRVRRHPLNFKQWSLVDICLVTTPAIAWIIYFGLTLNSAVTLTLLDSESAGVAEIAYEERFKREVKTLDEAVRLAVNKHRAPNVRFYAACLVAERLFISDELVVTDTLKRVDVAPMIDAQFIGGNRLTDRFYAPGRAQPHLTVRQVIEQRLLDLRTSE